MGETYWIAGAQLGMIIAFAKMNDGKKTIELVENIIEHQLTTKEAREFGE